jgi:hypothetical protein
MTALYLLRLSQEKEWIKDESTQTALRQKEIEILSAYLKEQSKEACALTFHWIETELKVLKKEGMTKEFARPATAFLEEFLTLLFQQETLQEASLDLLFYACLIL